MARSKRPTEDDFIRDFVLSKKMTLDFLAFVDEEGVDFDADGWETSRDAISLRIKAMIGRNMLEQSTFYRVISGLNESLQRAVTILQDGTFEKANLAHDSF